MDSFPIYEDDGSSLFPVNITLEDARAAVAGRIDFRETAAHDYVSFIYFLGMAPDLFPDPNTAENDAEKRLRAIRRECRGIIFHKDGHVLSRRFQKFFNIGELPETSPDTITIKQPFVLLEKLDGSMIAPFFVEGKLRYCTKSGLTDSSAVVERFVAEQVNIPYDKFCTEAIQHGFTPIFEYCSPSGRIVLEYKEESLHLLALRHVHTGRYIPFDHMTSLATSKGVPVVKKWPLTNFNLGEEKDISGESLKAVMKLIQAQEGVEGFVMQQENGIMYKIKTLWYFQIHRSTQFVKYYGEKHVWEAILSGTIDDVKAWLPSTVRDAINAFASELTRRAEDCASRLEKSVSDSFKSYPSRSDFNKNVIEPLSDPFIKPMTWQIYEALSKGQDASKTVIFEWILKRMLENTSSPKLLKKNVAYVGDLSYESYRPKNETPHLFNEE